MDRDCSGVVFVCLRSKVKSSKVLYSPFSNLFPQQSEFV